MAPQANPFKIVRMGMTGAGLPPSTSAPNGRLMVVWSYIMCFLTSLLMLNNTLGFAFDGDEDLPLVLENVAFTLTGLMAFSRVILMMFWKKQLYKYFEMVESLMEEIEEVLGPETFLSVTKTTNALAAVYTGLCIFASFPTYALAYYKYYFEGVEDAIPFGIFMPMEKKNNIHCTVLYQMILYYGAVYSIAVSNMLIITNALISTEMIAKIGERYQYLDLKDNQSVKQTIQWHSRIISIVDETNSLFGVAFVLDHLLAMVYISIAGYLVVRVGLTHQSSLPKYLIVYIAFLANPSLSCCGGHLISTENDELMNCIVSNHWYTAPPRERRTLILPELLANKRLCWNYKGIFYFDMNTYFQILRQSYSFITMLRLMDGKAT